MELSLRTVCETPTREGCDCFCIPDTCMTMDSGASTTSSCMSAADICCDCSVMPIDVADCCCSFSPLMDVIETKSSIMVTAELPGMKEEDIDVSVHDGILTVKGNKKIGKQRKGTDYHQLERSSGSFSRSMCLPDTVDSKLMKTVYENGVLTLTLPKHRGRHSHA